MAKSAIEIIISPIDEVVDNLVEIVKSEIFEVVDKFFDIKHETDIQKYVDILRWDLNCVIEYPYVDKMFRDSYYNYFSSKHTQYKRDCIRVSLFKSKIAKEDFLIPKNHKKLQKSFMGYFTIRPTPNGVIGRSIICPEALKSNQLRICRYKHHALIFGVKLEVEGFPHSSQDQETIKCAETTIWTLMEYFGNKYADYKPALPATIIEALKRFSYQRQLPSNGLTMDQISFALMQFGFGTRIYSSAPYKSELFEVIDMYIESGIPFVVGLESGDLGHAVVLAGKQKLKKIDWTNIKGEKLEIQGDEVDFFDTSKFENKYVIQDDNHTPYNLISLGTPGENYEDDDSKSYSIDSIVVPLYPKIYLEAVVAKELAQQILKSEKFGYKYAEELVFRFYLASSRSFKNHIASLEHFDEKLKFNMLILKMPKFIWCAELYDKKGFEKGDAIGLIILDATEANRESIDALLFVGHPSYYISMVDNKYVILQQSFNNYSYYSNLK